MYNGFYDELDAEIAEELGTSLEEYIEKIESMSEERATKIIFGIMSGEGDLIKKSKELFKDYSINK